MDITEAMAVLNGFLLASRGFRIIMRSESAASNTRSTAPYSVQLFEDMPHGLDVILECRASGMGGGFEECIVKCAERLVKRYPNWVRYYRGKKTK